MKLGVLVHQFRVFVVTILAGLTLASLGTLVVHYGLTASALNAENLELKSEVKGLVERLAEIEGEMHQVNSQRKQLDDMTLAAVGAVLGTTSINPEKDGKVYLAAMSTAERQGAAPSDADATASPIVDQSAQTYMGALSKLANVKQKAALLLRDMQATASAVALRQEVLAAIPSRMPAKGWISSGFGVRVSPFHGTEERMHNGVDIAADIGTPVYATADGVVAFAGEFGSYGKYIKICHGFGICTRYAHNGELRVKKGQKVKRGDQIALIGVTGRTTGPHVHYEVLIHEQPVDPAAFFFESKIPEAPAGVSATASAARPMGGEDFAANDGSAAGDQPLAARLLALTGEPLVFAAALPEPMRRATTSDVMLLAAILVMLTVASSLVRVPEAGAVGGGFLPATLPPAAQRRFDWGLWSGEPAVTDEGEED